MVISANMTGISGFYKGYEGRNDLHFFGESLQMTAPKPYQLLKSKFGLVQRRRYSSKNLR